MDDRADEGMNARVFVITVSGELDQRLRDEFDDVEITVERSITRFRVTRGDASLLHGILHRIDRLGLELLDVHRRPEGRQMDLSPRPHDHPSAGEVGSPARCIRSPQQDG
jgi:hypothetical protein